MLLAALFALPMTVEQLAISYQKHTWRNAHEPSLVIGRRCGKSHDGFLRLRLSTRGTSIAKRACHRPGKRFVTGVTQRPILADRYVTQVT